MTPNRAGRRGAERAKVAQMSATVQAIIQNAERLLQDARFLAYMDSYRTAIALAILSLKESGKACLVIWTKEGHIPLSEWEAVTRGHIDKQRILVTYNMLRTAKSMVETIGEDGSYELAITFEPYPIVQREAIEHGLLDWSKQAGFYTDIDSALNVTDPVIEFSEEDFEMFASLADQALQMAKSKPDHHEIMAALYKAYKADWAMPTKERSKDIDTIVARLLSGLKRLDADGPSARTIRPK
jgi:AbiV family abortive infection protein